jgi:hypothetical protein
MAFAQSAFNIANVTAILNNAISPVEDNMTNLLAQIQASPENVPQQTMTALQAEIQVWSSLTQTESSIVKQLGDTMKQVAGNIGT